MANRPVFSNYGTFRKLYGTELLTNILRLYQQNSGTFIVESDIFRQFLSRSLLYGQFIVFDNSVIDVHNSHLTAFQPSVWDGLGGVLRTNHLGIVLFHGKYNLTLDFVHDIGNFTFTPLANIELDSVTVHDGVLVFEEGKERTERFDLDSLKVTGGNLDILDVPQHLWLYDYEQTGGSIKIQNVSNHFTIGSIMITGGQSDISHILLNTTFLYRAQYIGGKLELTYLYQWLIFLEGLYVAPANTFNVKHVFNNVWTPKDFHLRGTVSLVDLRNRVLIDDILLIDQHNNADIEIIDVANVFIVLNGTEVRSGSLKLTNLNDDVSTKHLKVYNVAGFTSPVVLITNMDTFTVQEIIEISGTVTVNGSVSVDVPVDGKQYFTISNNYRGEGGFSNIITLPLFITASLEPRGGDYLFDRINSNYLVPSFSIQGGSHVHLLHFGFDVPVLHDIEVLHGFLRLNTSKTVMTDYLVVNGPNAVRDGNDITQVANGVDFIQGRFGIRGATEAFTYLNLSSSGTKTVWAADLIAPNLCIINVQNGEVVGINGATLQLRDVTNVIGDFFSILS
ncbi:hypothetical protein GEMRC1_002721 [Eukaryota sp. GEM-RC1]